MKRHMQPQILTILVCIIFGPVCYLAAKPSLQVGIDVSHHQGLINWTRVRKSGVSFAFVKATEGATYTDPMFMRNWKEMTKNGLANGVYHFFRPKTSPPASQFLNLMRALRKSGAINHGYVIIDVESASSKIHQTADDLNSLLTKLSRAIGSHRLMIYTARQFWNRYVDYHKYSFTQYKLWVAHYTRASRPRLPGLWRKYAVWQYSDKGRIPGINGFVDVNRGIYAYESADSHGIFPGAPDLLNPIIVKDQENDTRAEPIVKNGEMKEDCTNGERVAVGQREQLEIKVLEAKLQNEYLKSRLLRMEIQYQRNIDRVVMWKKEK